MRYLNGVRSGMAQAQHRAMPTYNSKQFEAKVGGTRSQTRARFGAHDVLVTDDDGNSSYVESDRNMKLSRVVTTVNESTDLQHGITDMRHSNARDYITEWQAPSVDQILAWAKRAERKGMTIEQYVSTLGIPVTFGV